MRPFPRQLRQIFRPIAPRSSAIEQGLVLVSILGAVVLAAMALIVHHTNGQAEDAFRRSVRSTEVTSTLARLQLALRDGEIAGRDLAGGRRERSDVERFDAARFAVRLNLTALGPLAGDEPAQSERLSRLGPLINRKLALGLRASEAGTSAANDEIDRLVTAMRDGEMRRLDTYRSLQSRATTRSTWIMLGSLVVVSLLFLAFWMLLKIEVGARRALERRLIESATIDELTGAATRSDFDRKLVQEWAFRQRYATALSLLIVDIDHLKQHNDRWGHVAGDVILRDVARRLASPLRRTELLARAGGDQFAVIVPQYRNEALALAEQLRVSIAEAPVVVQTVDGSTLIPVTVSIGVAEASDVDTPRELLVSAEQAADAAKQRGRNGVVSFKRDPATGVMQQPRTEGAAIAS